MVWREKRQFESTGTVGRRMTEWPAYEVIGIGFGRRVRESGPVQGPAAMTRLLQGGVICVLSVRDMIAPCT